MRTITRDWNILSSSRHEFEASEEQREILAAAVRSLDTIVQERNVIHASFADPTNPLPLIEAIENLGRRLGVRSNLALISSDGPPSYTVTAEGTFPEVFQFLERLESLPFLIQFGDVHMVSAGGLRKSADMNSTKILKGQSLISLTTTVRTITP